MSITTVHLSSDGGAYAAVHAVLRDVEQGWNAAARDWNVDALTAMYADDAVFFGGREGHAVGLDAIRRYFASYLGVVTSARMELVDQCVSELAEDTILAQGYASFDFILADGNETSSRLRTTWILVKRGGNWKLLQHHFSPTPEAPPIR